MSYFKKRIRSLGFAFSGLKEAFRRETHLKLHFLSAILVVVCGVLLNVSKSDWLILSLAIILVMAFEMINTAIEKLCDFIRPEQDLKIKYIKDVSAGAVLLACIFAIIAGLFVFLPYILKF